MNTTPRRHTMPFGAEVLDDGRVRFRLWAPGARHVDVSLVRHGEDASASLLPMDAETEGWFDCTTAAAGPGTRYRFRIDGKVEVPDPASRFQPRDVHGPSEVIDPTDYRWQDRLWQGRPWEETVVYEVHVGSFTPQGDFTGVRGKLDHLVALGITAIELMPVADFPGGRNWGYDGTYLFAPDSRYGTPNDLKALVDAAHARGLMVFLDVVYNHFGPEGNYLHLYAPVFFSRRHHTPWGDAVNFDGRNSHWVRRFFVENALYWLEEYHLDGLRLDAVHAIADDSRTDILTELAARVRGTCENGRHIHLVLEHDRNATRYLERDGADRPGWYDAQWNDDFHHALHVLLTGETDGYYQDYADAPIGYLARCLAEGFAYQGERSAYRDNTPRGEPSGHLPATAFLSFLQNHDQVGNRAFGERINTLLEPEPLHAALALLLLSPSPPLLFMGQEWGCNRPFAFFCDFSPDVAEKVIAGRRRELSRFSRFRGTGAHARIPDPTDRRTFESAVLDWNVLDGPDRRYWLKLHQELLAIRRRALVPRLGGPATADRDCKLLGERALSARWTLNDDSILVLTANLGDKPLGGLKPQPGPLLYGTHGKAAEQRHDDGLPPWAVFWYLYPADAQMRMPYAGDP